MIFVVFTSRAEFDAFKAETPKTEDNPFTRIGEPVAESCDAEGNLLPDSRLFVAHHFTAAECEFLKTAGAIVRIGGVDGPDWPGEATA